VTYKFSAALWRWKGDAPASWMFLTVPADIAFAVTVQAETRAWGSVRVTARIGATAWSTSLFPEKGSGSYLLPVKAAVRRAERLGDGDTVEVELTMDHVATP